MTLAPVLRATHVPIPPKDAFALFTDQIGAWWPLTTHGLFGEESAGVAFDGERLVERATDGRTVTWGEVVTWDAPVRLVVSWHPGQASGGSRVEVRFIGDDDGTRVELIHDGWDALGDKASAQRSSYAGRDAWGTVLDHFTDLQVRSAAATDDAALAGLAAAYEEFFAEALAGGFAAPSDGGFTAEQVVAHVAVNDDTMSAVCRAVIKGAGHPDGVVPTARFENDVANARETLQAWVEANGNELTALVAAGRRRAEQFRLLLARLDDDEREVAVHARLSSDGEVMVDDDLPWGRLAIAVQTARHLPGHTEQLRALRA